MQKTGNLYLTTDTPLSVSQENENNIEKKLLNVNNSKRSKVDEEFYDHKNQITNYIREEIILQHRPPKNSLSELIFNNDIEQLEKILTSKDIDANMPDNCGSTHSWTPLYWAVKMRRIECMQILLDFGVDINIVIHDCDECCGTVLDLATLREDKEIENLLREFAEKEDVNLGQSYKAIRTKLRGKAPAFNFRYFGNKKKNVDVE